MKLGKLLLLAGALLGASVSVHAQLIDSINGSSAPYVATWGARTVAFQYQPGFSYELYGVDSLFPAVTGGALTLDFWQGRPSAGGTLLASTTFTPVANVWTGGVFDAPVHVDGGSDYWVGFWNIYGQGANVTTTGIFTTYEWYDGPDYSGGVSEYSGFGALLHFNGVSSSSPVPEPSTYGLLGAGVLLGLAIWRRRAARR